MGQVESSDAEPLVASPLRRRSGSSAFFSSKGGNAEREEAIDKLLSLCEESDVHVPPELVDSLRLSRTKDSNNDLSASGGSFSKRSKGEDLGRSFLEACIDDVQKVAAEMEESEYVESLQRVFRALRAEPQEWELRVTDNASYTIKNRAVELHSGRRRRSGDEEAPQDKRTSQIPTVANMGCVYKVMARLRHCMVTGRLPRTVVHELPLLTDVNLRFKSGKTYLVLGAPGAGKTTLLKAIAQLHTQDKTHILGGRYTINRVATPKSKGFCWENLVSYVDQIDRHHEQMTVKETLAYAFNCRQGGTHRTYSTHKNDPVVDSHISKIDKEMWFINKIMEGLGLSRVKDTFVGNEDVRGVSGGERKRVTTAEILAFGTPIVCMDEVSTGLDAATTYDIVDLCVTVARLYRKIWIISLLQPPPETVALFDELILVDKGDILYSGPVSEVVAHFEGLGYEIPERMDMADWLQSLPTPDGAMFLKDLGGDGRGSRHLTRKEFVAAFKASPKGRRLAESLALPFNADVSNVPADPQFQHKFANPWYKSLWLVIQHEFLVWRRAKQRVYARMIQCAVMALIVGTVFWQVGDQPSSMVGVIYQSLFFISLGGLQKVLPQVDSRGVFYKHQDANMFPPWTFVVGRSIAYIPASILDTLFYGVVVFFFTGMAYTDGASIANFFIFLLLVLLSAYTTLLVYSILSATCPDRTTAMSVAIGILVLMTIFSGFTVQPDVIPVYWIWLYWGNYFGWMLRAVLLNQYLSGAYDEVLDTGLTQGETVLTLYGFTFRGEPFSYEWVWYGCLFAVGCCIVAVLGNALAYRVIRFQTGQTLTSQTESDDEGLPTDVQDDFDLPFQPVTLTFKDIHYTVTMSTSKEKIELLKGIDGYFEPGKMTALMGSSGAGKTTLMDVLALRKSSGIVSGEVRLNGHHQESNSFRRCAGYVEQFDVQSAQLTIRETVMFSAKMRIDQRSGVSRAQITRFVEKTLKMLELSAIEDFLVGSDLTGGLSFEQRKRLSIAVELASNPSIIFLDEPTSGLDARAAAIVMRGLKRIANSGRAICATIHQPSVAIFNSFDSLLLLKRGGETVFFGELGENSVHLITYLERFDTTPSIRPGENPATWMLTTIGSGTSGSGVGMDYARAFANSSLRKQCLEQIKDFNSLATESNVISYRTKFATTLWYQCRNVLQRAMKVYWRSPNYNRSRLIVSAIMALVFGSVYAANRVPKTESDMNSRVTSIYISALFLGTSGLITVLPFFEKERNMYYRHKAALMYDQRSINLSCTIAEIPFLLASSMIFTVCFYFPLGFKVEAVPFFIFYFFTTANMAIWTYLGQTCISLFSDAVTANGFGAVVVSMSSIFAGVLIRPQHIAQFWEFMYWLLPMHYVIEGLTLSQFADNDTPILAEPKSLFYLSLLDDGTCVEGQTAECYGPADQWFYVNWGGYWVWENVPWNVLYMFGAVLVIKFIGVVALAKLNYLNK